MLPAEFDAGEAARSQVVPKPKFGLGGTDAQHAGICLKAGWDHDRCRAWRVFESIETQQAYRRRKWLSEPPNGWIKNVLGFRQFSMRGLAKAKAEWQLVCAALNLRSMAVLAAA